MLPIKRQILMGSSWESYFLKKLFKARKPDVSFPCKRVEIKRVF